MTAADVVVTGMGSVSPHGRGVHALWQGLLAGRSSFTPITLFDAKPFRNTLAGEVAGYESREGLPPRATRMLLDACGEALAQAVGLAPETPAAPAPAAQAPAAEVRAALARHAHLAGAALVAGTNFGGMSAAERGLLQGEGDPKLASLEEYLFGSASRAVAQAYGLGGPRLNLSLACASGAAAIGVGLDLIRTGRAQAVLACGYDELSLFIYAGLSALHAITPETIRPFDKRRKGTLFAEGAAAMLLEEAGAAQARGAPPLARVLGRAMNNDGYHMTAPEQEARGIQALMRAALADAGLAPDAVDHLNLHATGTPYNDKIETKAVMGVFGPRGAQIPVAAVKSSIGHTMGAAGLHEAIAAVQTLGAGLVPPVLGLDPAEQDPECGLQAPTGAPLPGAYRTVLKTSYGFGGTNAAVVFARA